MIIQEVDWIESHHHKLSPDLKELAMDWYRPVKFAPGILQTYLKSSRKILKKVPVIIQVGSYEEYLVKIDCLSKYEGCKIKSKLPLINSFTAKVNAKYLKKIVSQNTTKKVWLDRTVQTVLDVAVPASKAPAVWDRGGTGKGVGVAVIDTGIYPHPDISEKISAFKDFIGNKKKAYDDNGHGTHVAGCVASSGSQSHSLYKGAAPGTSLIGVKVLDKNGFGNLSIVIRAIQWCISNKNKLGIRVINLSVGSTAIQSYKEDALCQALEGAWQKGIVVCTAAGNDGPSPGSVTSPGIDPMLITVGAAENKNNLYSGKYQIADYSGRGPTIDNYVKPDVVCCGSDIISLRAPNSTLDKKLRQTGLLKDYLTLSGTSMAAPVCAGVVALMLEANKSLTPDQVKKRLMEKAKFIPGIPETAQGRGMVDADQSVRG